MFARAAQWNVRRPCLTEVLVRPIDASSVAVFRVLFGLIMFYGAVRFVWNGWVDRFFLKPTFFFKYWLFEWVHVPPAWLLYALFTVLAVSALGICVGLFYRIACVTFFFVFTYIELLDVTNYLNHYYLVSLIALLFCFLPLNRAYALDARRRPERALTHLPAWVTYLLRFQVGVVYVYAGLAKAGSDWLLHGQPLGIWLAARSDLPLVAALLKFPAAPLIMSWAGFLYDTSIVGWLLWPRSRPLAFVAVVVFHALTRLLFPIGMFPFIMVAAATIFFEPDWPRSVAARCRQLLLGRQVPVPRSLVTLMPKRRVHPGALAPPLERDRAARPTPIYRLRPLPSFAAIAYCVLQLSVPLRAHAYGGNVLWHEQGMRFAWRVMVREKNGTVTYLVRSQQQPRWREVGLSRYLTSHQEREMSGQPDLVLQLAHHIAHEFALEGHHGIEVRARTEVSLNGRPPRPMIQQNVDLTEINDGIWRADWISGAPDEPPFKPVVASRSRHAQR